MVRAKHQAFFWVIAAAAAAVAFLPSVLHMPTLALSWLPALQGAACIAFLGGVGYMLFGGSGGPTVATDLTLPEPSRDVVPTAMIDMIGEQALDQRIQQSVESSLTYSRTVGLIYFDLDCYAHLNAEKGTETADRAMLEIAALLRTKVRAYDYVMRLENDKFVICLSHLREKSELSAVAGRLGEFVQQIRVAGMVDRIEPAVGQAIYPMCGYTGGELVDFARTSALHDKAQRLGGASAGEIIHQERAPSALSLPAKAASGDVRLAPLVRTRPVGAPQKKLRRRTPRFTVVNSEATEA
jgi:diguanylate cyclase (GGDEF)-like protein